MNFNGENLTSELANGGTINGSLEVLGNLCSTDLICLQGKYKLPTTAPLEPNSVIVSDGSDQLIWTGDLSIGDVTSITGSTVNNEVVLFNGTTGKSIKNSSITVVSGIVNDNGEVMTNNSNNDESAVLKYEKSRSGGALLAGDNIGTMNFYAHDGTGLNSVAFVRCATEVNMNPANRASQLQFFTTNENTAAPVIKMTLWDGGVDIPDNKIIFSKNGLDEVKLDSDTDGYLRVSDSNNDVVAYVGPFSYINRGDGNTGLVTNSTRPGGTFASPLSIRNNDSLHTTYDQGWDSSTYSLGSSTFTAGTENWTPSAHGSKYVIRTCNNGSTSLTDKLVIDTTGVNIPTSLNIPDGAFINLKNASGDWAISNTTGNLYFDKSNGRARIYYGGSTIAAVRSNDDNAPPIFDGIKSRGFINTPTAVLNNDLVVNFRGAAYNGTAYVNVSTMETKATENHGTGTNGSSVTIKTVNNGTSALVEKMVIDTAGVNVLTPLNIGNTGAGTNYVLPSTKGSTGQHLRLNGNNMEWATDGGGDVSGPNSAGNNFLAKFDGSSGKLLKNSGVDVNDTNQIFYGQGFNFFSVQEYCFFKHTDPTITVTGTTPVTLVSDAALPVALSWVGKSLKCYMSGTITNGNNESIRHSIDMFDKGAFSVFTSSSSIPTLSSFFEFEYRFEIAFRSNGTGVGWFEYIVIDNLGNSPNKYRIRGTISNTWNTNSTTFPFSIKSYWTSANVANIAYFRNIRISFI